MPPQTVTAVVDHLEATSPETVDLYGTLAPVYEFVIEHAGVPETQLRAVAGTIPDGTTSLVEYACGMGSLLARLEPRYDDVVGLDRSRQQLALARRKTDVSLVRADVRDSVFDAAFEAAVLLGHSLGHLTGEEDVRQCFDAVAEALLPGGVFFFDCHALSAYDEPQVRENVGDGDRYHVTHRGDVAAADERGLVERSDSFTVYDREQDRTVTAATGSYTFRAHELDEVEAHLEAAGFRLCDVRAHDRGFHVLARHE